MNTNFNFYNLEMRSLSFNYPSSSNFALENINLKIKKNQTIGIIGPSGAGKTTLIDIILGLLEPKKGDLLINDRTINEVKNQWHSLIGYIPQNIMLLDDTISNNISFNLSGETANKELLDRAIKLSKVDKFIEDLPEGIGTNVGNKGIKLSGGQLQRVGIARALYNRPKVILMDEGTNSLDNETEKEVIEAIISLKKDHTLIIVAHNLKTIKDCDCIYLFENGKILDSGTYLELENRQDFVSNYNLD